MISSHNTHTACTYLVLEVDDVRDGGRVLQDAPELGQQVVRRDDVRRLRLVEPVHHRLLAKVRVDGAQRETLLEDGG